MWILTVHQHHHFRLSYIKANNVLQWLVSLVIYLKIQDDSRILIAIGLRVGREDISWLRIRFDFDISNLATLLIHYWMVPIRFTKNKNGPFFFGWRGFCRSIWLEKTWKEATRQILRFEFSFLFKVITEDANRQIPQFELVLWVWSILVDCWIVSHPPSSIQVSIFKNHSIKIHSRHSIVYIPFDRSLPDAHREHRIWKPSKVTIFVIGNVKISGTKSFYY